MLRDDETTTAHNAAVSRGDSRIPAIGKDRKLHSCRASRVRKRKGLPRPID